MRSIVGAAAPATHARGVAGSPTDAQSEDDPAPCERTRQTPRPDPTLLLKHALAVTAAEYAAADAGFSHNGLVQLKALARVTRSVHRADTALAERLLSASEAVFERVEPSYSRSLAAGELARAQARFDAERGEDTARRIVQPYPRTHALVLLAEDFTADEVP